MSLKEYRNKRDFHKTKEPRGRRSAHEEPMFVVQKHWASHLHYDFRLEAFGVLKSWAIPKGPSLDPKVKRLAVEVEDHPVAYGDFEGQIPKGEYGGGEVIVWDHGTWDPPDKLKNNLLKGHLDFELHGEKLKGKWLLQRTRQSSSGKNQWLLIKKTDDESRAEDELNVTEALPDSVLGKRSKKQSGRLSRKSDASERLDDTELVPKLALLVNKVPEGKEWIYETKYDGYRTFALLNNKAASLRTRSGLDWTEKYGPIAKEVEKIKARQLVLDGEIVCLDEHGKSTFQGLQKALKEQSFENLAYYVFDLLVLNGQDLRKEPLEKRKRLLKDLLKKSSVKKVIYSQHLSKAGAEMFKKACSKDLEGIVAKDKTAPYVGGRQPDWQKIKCTRRQEFVIGGYTDPQGLRSNFGALLMGVYEDGKLKYAGKVGTGFDAETLATTIPLLEKNEVDKSPFQINSPHGHGIHWVRPKLIAEIEFRALTSDGLIRHGSFQGLRLDKNSEEVELEIPKNPKKAPSTALKKKKIVTESEVEDIKITHPDRIIYAKTKTTKWDVVEYYKGVQKWILPHIAGRPLSLLRCTGTQEKGFFQKHIDFDIPDVEHLNFKYKSKPENIMYVESAHGMLELAQWGGLEFHVWGSTAPKVLEPNLIVFDLDPSEDVTWNQVKKTAFEIKSNLEKLGLKSYVKVTGGKGVHIHVPCGGKYSWDQIKNFAKTFVMEFEQRRPDLYITKANKNDRKGKIFLDYLRNGFGATAVAPYSLRAKDKPTVALPLEWNELKSLKAPNSFLLKEVVTLLKKRKKDPWAGYFENHQLIKLLE